MILAVLGCALWPAASAANRGAAVPRERPHRAERQPLAETAPAPAPAPGRAAADAPAATSGDVPPATAGPDAQAAGSEPEPGLAPAADIEPQTRLPPPEPERAKAAAPTKPADKPAPPKLCELVACRVPGKIQIVQANGSAVEIGQPGYAFVTPAGVVTVLPGETVAVEFAPENGKLMEAAYAPQVRAPERTVRLELAKSEGAPMLLKVSNPFAQPLKYDASIEIVGRDGKAQKLRRTSTCAVAPGAAAFEMWPEAIARVQAENFRLLAAGDTSCK